MWRQGDVFIMTVASIPPGAEPLRHGVLVEGEATGHSHVVEDLDAAQVFRSGDNLYLRVVGRAVRIVHQEHGPITLSPGTYRVWKQREYIPGSVRAVAD